MEIFAGEDDLDYDCADWEDAGSRAISWLEAQDWGEDWEEDTQEDYEDQFWHVLAAYQLAFACLRSV